MSFSRSSRAANGLFRRLAVTPGSAAARGVPGTWTQVRRATIETMFFERTRRATTRERAAGDACVSRAMRRGGTLHDCAGRYRATRVYVSGDALRRRHDRARRVPLG